MAADASGNTHVVLFSETPALEKLLDSLFDISGLNTQSYSAPDAFVAEAPKCEPDIIVLATGAPALVGQELLAQIKQPSSELRDVPVIMIFPEATPVEVAVEALHLGAYDYLSAPFNEIELLTKITVLAKVKHAEDEFRELAIRDRLTGLYDRRYLFIRAGEELSRARRYSKPITFLALDIDNLAAVNDEYGAEAGDALLQRMADLLVSAKREIDVLARADEDLFVMVLYNTDATGAMVLASRILEQSQQIQCPFCEDYTPTVSVGLSTILAEPDLGAHAQELQDRAVAAMEQARSDGGNRIVVHGQ